MDIIIPTAVSLYGTTILNLFFTPNKSFPGFFHSSRISLTSVGFSNISVGRNAVYSIFLTCIGGFILSFITSPSKPHTGTFSAGLIISYSPVSGSGSSARISYLSLLFNSPSALATFLDIFSLSVTIMSYLARSKSLLPAFTSFIASILLKEKWANGSMK